MNAKLDSTVATRPVTRQTFDEVIVPTYAPANMIPVRASGLDLWDQNGKHYLDFTSGIAVASLGHCNPVVVEALTRQANTLWHLGNGYTNEPVLRLALALTEATFADRAFFCNSGAEANEAALKLARKVAHAKFGDKKPRIVSCLNSFHGRTRVGRRPVQVHRRLRAAAAIDRPHPVQRYRSGQGCHRRRRVRGDRGAGAGRGRRNAGQS
jgi:acetylornithine/N-succinyldiaminopimelate aminotransferase